MSTDLVAAVEIGAKTLDTGLGSCDRNSRCYYFTLLCHQLVQGLFNALSEFITTGNDLHAKIIEALTIHFHRGVLKVMGTPHLQS